MAVTIITNDGTFQFPDTTPEQVTQTGASIKIVNSRGQQIAKFHRVHAWFETTAANESEGQD